MEKHDLANAAVHALVKRRSKRLAKVASKYVTTLNT